MKLIYSKTLGITNLATVVTATSEDPEYPASNLILGRVSKVWRSYYPEQTPIINQTLTITVPAGASNTLAIFGTNATSAIVTVSKAGPTVVSTETFIGITGNRIWKEWIVDPAPLTITVVLFAPSTAFYHECGEIVVGESVTISDPQYGLSQSRENYQTVQQLTGGGRYIHDGAKPRTFDLAFILDRETDFDNLDEIFYTMGENPIAMLLSDRMNNGPKWCGYFHMVGAPKAAHQYLLKSPTTLQIREAV